MPTGPGPWRVYLDEHVGHAVASALRRLGLDVQTVVEAGLRGADDRAQLAHALRERRILVTYDADFLRLHASGVSRAGIVFVTPRMQHVGQLIRGLQLLSEQLAPGELAGRIELV